MLLVLLLGACIRASPVPSAHSATGRDPEHARLHAIGQQLVVGAVDSAIRLADQDTALASDDRAALWRFVARMTRPAHALVVPDTLVLRPMLGLWGVDVRLPRSTSSAGDTTLTWILDTGSNITVVSEGSAHQVRHRRLDEAVRVGSFTGRALAGTLIVLDSLRIGQSLLVDVPAVVLPDSALRMAAGILRIGGILGMPEIGRLGRRGPLLLDVHRRQLRLSTAARTDAPVPLRFAFTKPFVTAVVDGVAGECHLDTGARLTTLSARWLAALPSARQAGEVRDRSSVSGVGGTREVEVRRFPSVALRLGRATIRVKNPEVLMTRTTGSLEQSLCNFGLDALFQLDSMAIDVTKSRVMAWPRPPSVPRDSVDRPTDHQ